jgi:GNAT superfamily N-acetyltransferase
MIELRVAECTADLDTWARIKCAVVPNEPVTADQLAATAEPDRLLLLASLDGIDVGCGIAALSDFGGRAFLAARVLQPYRRRGVGTAMLHALAEHGRALGRDGVNAFIEEGDEESLAFARRFGLEETDYQLEQIRVIERGEAPPVAPEGIELVPLAGRRDELLRAAWEAVAQDGYADMPLPGPVTYRLDTWLRDEATRPAGSFVAMEDGEIVGYAGLMEHANGDATAEHGLTAVRRDRRRRGIARALKTAQIHWASAAGVVELVTWTQKGNEAMQALNRSLGYSDHSKVLTMQGPLPAAALDDQPTSQLA